MNTRRVINFVSISQQKKCSRIKTSFKQEFNEKLMIRISREIWKLVLTFARISAFQTWPWKTYTEIKRTGKQENTFKRKHQFIKYLSDYTIYFRLSKFVRKNDEMRKKRICKWIFRGENVTKSFVYLRRERAAEILMQSTLVLLLL